jgi:16S rRNA (guanine527-N7)-methyltransferase
MDFTQYFPALTERQTAQYAALQALYTEWNAKINVISRKDIDSLYEHHVQHSLAVACFVEEHLGGWAPGSTIVDVGTGGGFPGIPLAIFYPECQFLLVDRIGKKVRVATEVAQAIGLTNVQFRHAGIEEVSGPFDFAVSRAVMPLPDLWKLVRRKVRHGLICLKGGELADELSACRGAQTEEVSKYFREEFFETKKVVSLLFPEAK